MSERNTTVAVTAMTVRHLVVGPEPYDLRHRHDPVPPITALAVPGDSGDDGIA